MRNSNLLQLLKQYCQSTPVPVDPVQQEQEHLAQSNVAKSLNFPPVSSGHPEDSSFKLIPKFFNKTKTQLDLQSRRDPIGLAMKRACQQAIAQSKAEKVLSNDDLDQVWQLLEQKSVKGADGNGKLSYSGFCEISKQLPKMQAYFRPSIFLRLMPKDETEIDSQLFFNFLLRRASLLQERICISVYDQDCDGYLYESELQKYIDDLIPTFPQLESLEKEFYSFYTMGAVRKFFFLLDHNRRGKISIKDLLSSPILSEFFELQQEDLAPHMVLTNWFSLYSSLKIYGQYMELDTDKNGTLSQNELSKFAKKRYTKEFLDRIFQEYTTKNGEIDYRGFLDLVLTMNDLRSPSALAYAFKLLDIYNQGYLDLMSVYYFAKSINERLPVPVDLEYFVNEIFDMASPKEFQQVTLQDLIKCGNGGMIISLLVDIHTLMQSQAKD